MKIKEGQIVSIFEFCKENCSELERWPSYFHRRLLEMQSYLELIPDTSSMKILELGCGIGYQSAMLAKASKQVIATDLPGESLQDHAPGMAAAARLHQKLNIHNVELIPCSAEELPFEDSSMDMVFSSHVLEHIPDQKKALDEIYRVLKPGGYHVCIVPVRFEKFYAFISFYSYLFKASLRRLKSIISKPKSHSQDVQSKTNVNADSILKYFPFPPPHGYSKHFINELVDWSCFRWKNKIKMNGKFKIIHQSSTQINPLLPLTGPLFPRTSAKIHSATRKVELIIGKLPIIRSLGINTIIIAVSNKEGSNAK
jgi:SAM-dependent methyltransferase